MPLMARLVALYRTPSKSSVLSCVWGKGRRVTRKLYLVEEENEL